MIEAGQTIQGKEVLEVKELPHPEDKHLRLVFCLYRGQYVSFLYNDEFSSFNYGRYKDDYKEGLESYKTHCEYYGIK